MCKEIPFETLSYIVLQHRKLKIEKATETVFSSHTEITLHFQCDFMSFLAEECVRVKFWYIKGHVRLVIHHFDRQDKKKSLTFF